MRHVRPSSACRSKVSAPLSLVSAIALSFCACELEYYGHLARGQARLVLECKPLEASGSETDSSATDTNPLVLVKAIRTFAESRVGLDANSNYSCIFDTGGQPVGWNVSACPPDRFEPHLWTFPIVGQLPYKGFFDRTRAEAERDVLVERGLDVIVRPLSAFSTLGYFSDPILSPMLDYSPERLSELIFHELTHGTVYVGGHTDFNESLATFVGQTASERFLAFHFGGDTPLIDSARAKRSDRARFRTFMTAVVGELDSLYHRDLPVAQVLRDRDRIFAAAKDRFMEMRPQFELLNYDGVLDWEMNNARMMSFRRYNRDLGEFQELFDRVGQRLDLFIDALKPCEREDDPWQCLRNSPASFDGTT